MLHVLSCLLLAPFQFIWFPTASLDNLLIPQRSLYYLWLRGNHISFSSRERRLDGEWWKYIRFRWKAGACWSVEAHLSSLPVLLLSVIPSFNYLNHSRHRLHPILFVVSFCTKYQSFELLISPTHSLPYPLLSLSVFPSCLFSPASFLPVARLLLLCELLNFMPGFLWASAQSHKVSLSSYCLQNASE